MKKIQAILRSFKLDEIKDALAENGYYGMTVSEVRGFGRQRGHVERYRGAEYVVDFVPKIMVEIVCGDDKVEPIIKIICDVSRTGNIGDGKIFVHDLEEVIRIRTGETGSEAI